MRSFVKRICVVLLIDALVLCATGASAQSPLLQGRASAYPSNPSDTGIIGPVSPSLLSDTPPSGMHFQQQPDFSMPPLADDWTFQVIPTGLIYRSYLAGPKEPRLGGTWYCRKGHGWMWDNTLGGRAGIIRYGTSDPILPEGWQIDVEGAAFGRLDLEEGRDVDAVDFRAGVPLTFRAGPWEAKIGYYHISAHLGDEYMLKHSSFTRINYVRDSIVLGTALRLPSDIRLYAEADWAFATDGGAKPWEFQFGAEYSPIRPTGRRGSPFFAIHGNLRQEVDYGGHLVVQAGWQWRGETGQLFRMGMHYMTGKNLLYQFFQTSEEQIGMGIWYDF